MPHSPLDLWAQVRALDGGQRLGRSYRQFCQTYGQAETKFVAGGVQRTIYTGIRPGKLEQLRDVVAPLLHQVTQDDLDRALGLDQPVDLYRTTTLDPATRRVYDRLEKDLIAQVGEGTVTAANAMVLVLRLAQATSGYAVDADTGAHHQLTHPDPPEKARLLADTLEDLGPEPVVVFARFHHDLDWIERVATKSGRRYGEISGRRRDGLGEGSRMAPNVDLVGCQVQAGGVGIDLTRAATGIYFSADFRLADHDQSRKRLHRPGQRHAVRFIHLLADDTVDHAVYGALRKRREVIGDVLAVLQAHNQGGTP